MTPVDVSPQPDYPTGRFGPILGNMVNDPQNWGVGATVRINIQGYGVGGSASGRTAEVIGHTRTRVRIRVLSSGEEVDVKPDDLVLVR